MPQPPRLQKSASGLSVSDDERDSQQTVLLGGIGIMVLGLVANGTGWYLGDGTGIASLIGASTSVVGVMTASSAGEWALSAREYMYSPPREAFSSLVHHLDVNLCSKNRS